MLLARTPSPNPLVRMGTDDKEKALRRRFIEAPERGAMLAGQSRG
jgi:hypothetical protein